MLTEVTQEYTHNSHRPKCKNCGASSKWHEARHFAEVWQDCQIWCTFCNSYLWVFDTKEGVRIAS